MREHIIKGSYSQVPTLRMLRQAILEINPTHSVIQAVGGTGGLASTTLKEIWRLEFAEWN